MFCKYYKDGECTCEDVFEEDNIQWCDECPHFVESDYDPYLEWIKDEDAKLHFQERCMD